ncbi:uncharacterized protein SPSC_06617 [Sporisorium scitamineum]|uniref:Uncharacterized protein n=1 Tax=Sporisorium scitamineum TaxID=49012 RepID=A0A140KNP8_9BASI|nr:uncharacterized protein SPSC_06617 [Sporisorium scitamineum]
MAGTSATGHVSSNGGVSTAGHSDALDIILLPSFPRCGPRSSEGPKADANHASYDAASSLQQPFSRNRGRSDEAGCFATEPVSALATGVCASLACLVASQFPIGRRWVGRSHASVHNWVTRLTKLDQISRKAASRAFYVLLACKLLDPCSLFYLHRREGLPRGFDPAALVDRWLQARLLDAKGRSKRPVAGEEQHEVKSHFGLLQAYLLLSLEKAFSLLVTATCLGCISDPSISERVLPSNARRAVPSQGPIGSITSVITQSSYRKDRRTLHVRSFTDAASSGVANPHTREMEGRGKGRTKRRPNRRLSKSPLHPLTNQLACLLPSISLHFLSPTQRRCTKWRRALLEWRDDFYPQRIAPFAVLSGIVSGRINTAAVKQ